MKIKKNFKIYRKICIIETFLVYLPQTKNLKLTMARRISKSYLCAVKCMYALVKFLDEENRECSRPEIFEHMQRHVNFTYWESEHMGSTIRWQLITRNMAYHYQRAGLLTRREEVYRITLKGHEALELGAEAMQREVDATIPT